MKQSTKSKQSHFKYTNSSQFPFLTQINQFKQSKQLAQNQRSWKQFLINSNSLMNKMFKFCDSDYILLEIDEKTKQAKIYQNHNNVYLKIFMNKMLKKQIKASLFINQIRKYNDVFQLSFEKNFRNRAYSPTLSYHWLKYSSKISDKSNKLKQSQYGVYIETQTQLGVKFDIQKWLSNSLRTNQKKIFLKHQTKFNPKLMFDGLSAQIYIQNRQNYLKQNQNQKILNQNIVKQNSDIFGYSLKLVKKNSQNLTYKCKFSGGYDYFSRYNFNKLLFETTYLKKLYENYVVELSIRGGYTFGKNLLQNDLLQRSKTNWVDDRSLRYLNARVNFVFSDYNLHIRQFVIGNPFLFIQGCVSQNQKHIHSKYQINYGCGIKFPRFQNASLDISLFRLGKNLDAISSSFGIVF